MKAVAYRRSLPTTDAECLIDVTLPDPRPGGRDLLVRVEAVSVNPVDTKIRSRVDPQGADKVLGWDAAGTVVAVGGDVTLYAFFSFFALVLVWRIRPKAVTNQIGRAHV